MAKYFITFVLLAFLALENNSIYSRIHAKTLTNGNAAHYMRQHQQQAATSTQTQTHHHKHKQPYYHQQQATHHNRPHKSNTNSDSNEEEALLNYIHLQRHIQHQQEHLQQHQQHYQERPKRRISIGETAHLRTTPRLWDHLRNPENRMYGDGPVVGSVEESLESSLEVSLKENILQSNTLSEEIPRDVSESTEVKSTEDNTKPCPKCESNRSVAHITGEELTRLRIEFVKQQILEKLRLKERPNVSARSLPKPIYEGTTIEHSDEKSKNKDLDDYYARTSKKFIFLERENRECQRLGAHPLMCFSFKIDESDADGFDVNTAVLWIFKSKQNKRNNTLLHQQTIVVSEVQQPKDSKYLPIEKTIAIQSVDEEDEWVKIDIEWPIKRWFGNHELSHLIHISCQSCDITSMEEMISVDMDYRPFIMVDTQNRRRPSRQKRSINCTDGVKECCREKLYISFDEIGWGDWIIQPRGYDAYFCRGSCSSLASVAQSSSHHSTFLQKVLSTQKSQKPFELIPCCTAKQYSSLQLVFMDSNNTATQKTFPNMVVESCGCR